MDTRTLLMGARALAVKEAGAIANTSIGAGVGAALGGTLTLLLSKKNLLRNTLMGAAGGAAAGGVAGNLPAAVKAVIKKNTERRARAEYPFRDLYPPHVSLANRVRRVHGGWLPTYGDSDAGDPYFKTIDTLRKNRGPSLGNPRGLKYRRFKSGHVYGDAPHLAGPLDVVTHNAAPTRENLLAVKRVARQNNKGLLNKLDPRKKEGLQDILNKMYENSDTMYRRDNLSLQDTFNWLSKNANKKR